ncbi:S-layer homology domain-containing protein [Alkaliphilus hydrothermalis]|uniref:SLH domain-containing protein n=1 Tax=Alkaliphilus hydrothermalis TaxID=1482730 RepID=A0ABS2NPT2_9FIRM|nr:S-layer homology domain-containing protein [Alkaliphilus hydrothermalis]MBM7614914.1 hypothetical protein [Alkaliphilus hydrothermalis]
MKKLIKRVILAFLTLTLYFQLSFANTFFPDMSNHWGQEYVSWVTEEMDLLEGFEDGSFRPNEIITRGEFLIALNNLLYSMKRYHDIDFTIVMDELPYQDLQDNTMLFNHVKEIQTYIEQSSYTNIKLEDIFVGDKFQLNKPINRYESALLVRAVMTPPVENIRHHYSDLSSDIPFYYEIMEVINNGIMRGYNDGTIRPSREVTRAEAATLLYRVHRDLMYLKENYLDFQPIKGEEIEKKLPLFQLTGDEDEDQLFINAITSLEYISFVGYIPRNESHLYDTEPTKTLWQLKNQNYGNLIGNNYYLILYDKGTGIERKDELVREGLLYLNEEIKYEDIYKIDGLYKFLRIAKQYVDDEEIIMLAEDYYQSASNEAYKVRAGLFIANEYLELNETKAVIDYYREMLSMEMELSIKKQLIKNYAYLISQEKGNPTAVDELLVMRKNTVEDGDNSGELEELRKLYTGIIKQLIMER